MTPDELKSRRDTILADALREADKRRHRRAARRAGAVVCTCALIAGVAVVAILRQNHTTPAPEIAVQPTTTTTTTTTTTRPIESKKPTRSLIVRGHASPRIVVQTVRAEDVKPAWQTISDDQLLTAMADAGTPSGIVNVDGKTRLVPIRRPPS